METLIERLSNWSKPKYGLPVPARELMAEAAKELQAYADREQQRADEGAAQLGSAKPKP